MIGITEQLREQYTKYQEIEKNIFRLLGKQSRYGKSCDCNAPSPIELRGDEATPPYDRYVETFCIHCGGQDEN